MKFLDLTRILNIILFLVLTHSLTAQAVVRGQVKDATTGEPLITANVIIQGTAIGAIADMDGRF